MSDLLDELHAQAALQLLRANTALGDGKVFDGEVAVDDDGKSADPPYVLVYTIIEYPTDGAANALDGVAVTCRTTWYLHCVGVTAAAARAITMQARQSLLNQRPTIPGRDCGLIEQIETVPPQADRTTGRLVMDAVVVFALTTIPG